MLQPQQGPSESRRVRHLPDERGIVRPEATKGERDAKLQLTLGLKHHALVLIGQQQQQQQQQEEEEEDDDDDDDYPNPFQLKLASSWTVPGQGRRPTALHRCTTQRFPVVLSIWVCLKIGNTPKPNGFADHYPY